MKKLFVLMLLVLPMLSNAAEPTDSRKSVCDKLAKIANLSAELFEQGTTLTQYQDILKDPRLSNSDREIMLMIGVKVYTERWNKYEAGGKMYNSCLAVPKS